MSGHPLLILVLIQVQGYLSWKEQVEQEDRESLEADMEPSRREWLLRNRSQAHQVVLSSLSDTSHAQIMRSCVLHSRKEITQSWQRALEGQFTHAYTTRTTTASYLVGEREQKVLFLFLNFNPSCQKASVNRTDTSPMSPHCPRRVRLQPSHRSNTDQTKSRKRKSNLIFAQCLIYFLPYHPSDIYKIQ